MQCNTPEHQTSLAAHNCTGSEALSVAAALPASACGIAVDPHELGVCSISSLVCCRSSIFLRFGAVSFSLFFLRFGFFLDLVDKFLRSGDLFSRSRNSTTSIASSASKINLGTRVRLQFVDS